MIKSFYFIAIRKFIKDNSYFAINISGLAIGLASFIFIALYVMNELSYDRFHSNYENIYRVNTIYSKKGAKGISTDKATSHVPLSRALLNEFPDVIKAIRVLKSEPLLIGKDDKKIVEENVLFGDSTLFDVFDFQLIKGNPKNALVNPRSLILSESYAKKYFAEEEPLGQDLTVGNDTAHFIVTGVFKDIPANSHLHFDMMGSLTTRESWNNDKWISDELYTYVVLNERSVVKNLEEKIQALVYKYIGPEIEFHSGLTMAQWEAAGNSTGYYLTPLEKIHLHSTSSSELEPTGSMTYIYIYVLIAAVILAIAIFNFVNLATAYSASRAKEVGIRKVIGSSRTSLAFQFTFESVMVSILAAIIAVILVASLMTSFETLVGKQLAFGIFNYAALQSIACLAIVVGIVAGLYPAIVLSQLQPVHVLKGIFIRGTKSGLRKWLVIIQFTASIVIIICTMVIYNQIGFMLNMDLGFKKEQVLMMKNPGMLKNNIEVFKNDLLRNPDIQAIAYSTTIPGKPHQTRSFRKHGEPETFLTLHNHVSYEYLGLMGMKMVAGRFFSKEFLSDSNAVVINESAAKAFGFDDPIGKNLTSPWKKGRLITIIGVVKDFHVESLHKKIEPMTLELNERVEEGYLSVKLNVTENIHENVGTIEEAWHRYADYPFQYFFFDQDYENLYRAEVNTGRVLLVFASLAIFISSLGLIGLTMYTISVRRKEIGIRKVLGAGWMALLRLLSSEFIWTTLIATVVSWPIAYFATDSWLTNFTDRTPFNIWLFVGATFIVALIGSFAISFQTIKACTSNPVDSLRSE